jgi:hypothetical protein
MSRCKCGQPDCDKETKGGNFAPGHDQKLRTGLEDKTGGIFNLMRLVHSAEDYSRGKMCRAEFENVVKAIFTKN